MPATLCLYGPTAKKLAHEHRISHDGASPAHRGASPAGENGCGPNKKTIHKKRPGAWGYTGQQLLWGKPTHGGSRPTAWLLYNLRGGWQGLVPPDFAFSQNWYYSHNPPVFSSLPLNAPRPSCRPHPNQPPAAPPAQPRRPSGFRAALTPHPVRFRPLPAPVHRVPA